MLRFHPSACEVVCFLRFGPQLSFEKGPPQCLLHSKAAHEDPHFLVSPNRCSDIISQGTRRDEVLTGVTSYNCKL